MSSLNITDPPQETESEMTDAEFCETYAIEIASEVAIYMAIPAAIVMFLLAFVQRRKTIWLSFLWGRPACFYPINFVDEAGRRWAFAACFAIMVQYISYFFDGALFWNPGEWDNEEWTKKFGWLSSLILLGNILHLGFIFYPLFACVSMRRKIPANILGMAYLATWLYFDISWYLECGLLYNDETLALESIIRLCIQVPIYIAQAAVLLSFVVDLVINCHRCYMKRMGKPMKKKSRWGGKETFPLQYIEFLMTHQPDNPQTLKEKLKNLFKYTKINGFKYPPRVICTMVTALLSLYLISTKAGLLVDGIFRLIGEIPFEALPIEEFLGPNMTYLVPRIPVYISSVRWSFVAGNIVSVLLHVGFMVHMVICYRAHVLLVMRGDRSWHYELNVSPASMMVAGMRYSGYQIAYIVWGYVIIFGILTLVSMAVSTLFVVPIMFGEVPWIVNQLIKVLPPVVVSLFIYYAQVIMCKFAFLQERGAWLALNNRRIYHTVCYFIFFFNIVVGAFAVLKRTLMSLVFGLLIISRLDRCLLMRGFEQFDSGYKSYLGMLEVDAHHNHPVLKGFVYILKSEVEDSKKRKLENGELDKRDIEKANGAKLNNKRRMDKRIRNKWWKLITLVNNPCLLIDRLHEKIKESKKNKYTADDAVDTIANAGTVVVGGGIFGTVNKISEFVHNI